MADKKPESPIPGSANLDVNDRCSICLEMYVEVKDTLSLPKCGHTFHYKCIQQWVMPRKKKETKRCPLCREGVNVENMPNDPIVLGQTPQESIELSGNTEGDDDGAYDGEYSNDDEGEEDDVEP